VGRVAAWGAASEAALLCHYFAGFIVALEALWLLRASRRWVPWTIAVFALTEAALVPLAVHQARAWPPPHSHGFQPRTIATNAFLSFATNEYPIRHPLLVAAAVSVVALVFVGFGTARERRGFSVALLLAAPTLLLPLLAQAAGHGIYYDRHLMGAWPPLAAALAVALAVRRLRFLGAVVAAVICAGSLVLVVRSDRRPALQRDDWRDAFASLGPARTTRAIVTNWNYERYPLRYYRPGATQMRPAGRAVAELDLVGVGEPPPVSPPPGFRLVARRHVQHLTVVRYVAAAPILVYRSLLRPAGSLPRRIGVFVEEPSRTQRTSGSRSSAVTRSNSVHVESTRTTPVPPPT
jgi:hypothetical protein